MKWMDARKRKNSATNLAICEFCNTTGPKSSFFSSSKRFCSGTCAHSYSATHRNKVDPKSGKSPNKKRKVVQRLLRLPSEMERQQCTSLGFDWGDYLYNEDAGGAPVNLFSHVPMSTHWEEIGAGMKVEVLNLDCQLSTKVFWIAQVVEVAGYKAKLRYEGFGENSSHDFWCNLCTLDVHAVGWCATIGKPLVPPQTIQYKYSNWKNFLVKRLTGAKTLPNDFQKRVVESMECPFQVNMRLEVVDKTQISRMRIGIVDEAVGGRLRLRYEDSEDMNDDFWCHCQSPLIHNVGWCEKVGHRILVASKDYKSKHAQNNARSDLFVQVKQVKSCGFKIGMKLEAIDPLNLSAVCVATVKKVLRAGYLMIGIDGSEAANGSDWFCYHCTSPSIFPVGFCEKNGIALSVPKPYKERFSWNKYLEDSQSQAAPVELFDSSIPDHGFKPHMKLEAVDLMEPRLVCVATVKRIVGRLLHVHFDGWENEYDQWVDCRSPDIYPVGWCELVGYDLQPPATIHGRESTTKKKMKFRGQTFLGKKKRKKITAIKKPYVETPMVQSSPANNPPIMTKPSNTVETEETESAQEKGEEKNVSMSTENSTVSEMDTSTSEEKSMKDDITEKEQSLQTPLNKTKDAEIQNSSEHGAKETDGEKAVLSKEDSIDQAPS